jgi:hypothetical protein
MLTVCPLQPSPHARTSVSHTADRQQTQHVQRTGGGSGRKDQCKPQCEHPCVYLQQGHEHIKVYPEMNVPTAHNMPANSAILEVT